VEYLNTAATVFVVQSVKLRYNNLYLNYSNLKMFKSVDPTLGIVLYCIPVMFDPSLDM